ncbi:MAG: plasmid stabilization protein [Methylophaga sp.]|nr:MAG: plasmid stabilization protein [Methylophaga sp.]
MAKYRFTTDAQADLIKIRHYTLKHWSVQQSEKYLLDLQQTIILLAEAPKMGIKRADISVDTFSFPHASHVIYYLIQQQYVLFYAVLHKNMVPNIHLANRSIDY